MSEQVYGPYPQTPTPMDISPLLATQRVKLFGQHLEQVSSSSSGCITWSTHYGLLSVAVQFKGPNYSNPWAGQISGDVTKTSPAFSDRLEVESWLEETLVNIRNQLLSEIPERASPYRDRNVLNLPPTPKIFGSNMDVDGTQSKLLWSKKYPFAAAYVKYDHCLPDLCWSAELQQMNDTITFEKVATVEEVQAWLERELVNARNKIAASIPPTYEETATELIPELLGMQMEWDSGHNKWILPGIRELCELSLIQTAYKELFCATIRIPHSGAETLDAARRHLENVISGLYEIIDLSMVQQKPGEAAKLFSKKSAWLPLPEEPLELPQFLIECGTHKMLCARHESGGWLIGTRLCTTWKCVLNEGTRYTRIPE